MPVEPVTGIKIAIDRGGTFTDIWATAPGQPDLVFKLLSVDPSNYDDAPTEGMFSIGFLSLSLSFSSNVCDKEYEES